MKTIATLLALAALMASSLVAAADFPNYYPKDGFQRVGILDAVQMDRQQIVINDMPFSLADSVVIHSPSSYSVPASQLRIGSQIGYKMAAGGRLITEIWLLPSDYKSPRQRR
jgi:hypothetical protein